MAMKPTVYLKNYSTDRNGKLITGAPPSNWGSMAREHTVTAAFRKSGGSSKGNFLERKADGGVISSAGGY